MDHRPGYHLVPNAAFGRYERLVLLKSMTLLTRHSSHSTPKARRQPPLPSQKAPASMTSLPQRRAPDDIVAATTPLVLSPLVSSAPFATPAFAAPRQTTDFRNRGADACTIRNTGSTDTAGSTSSYRRQHRYCRQHRQLPPAPPAKRSRHPGFPSNRGDFLIADSCNFAASSDYRTPVHSVPWRSFASGQGDPDAPRPWAGAGWGLPVLPA